MSRVTYGVRVSCTSAVLDLLPEVPFSLMTIAFAIVSPRREHGEGSACACSTPSVRF